MESLRETDTETETDGNKREGMRERRVGMIGETGGHDRRDRQTDRQTETGGGGGVERPPSPRPMLD